MWVISSEGRMLEKGAERGRRGPWQIGRGWLEQGLLEKVPLSLLSALQPHLTTATGHLHGVNYQLKGFKQGFFCPNT